MEVRIKVKGMHCKSCEVLLKDVLEEIPGTNVKSANFQKGEIVAEFKDEADVAEAKKRIAAEGYQTE